MKDKKSPLKDKLLRTAGQSLDEEINSIIDDKISLYILVPILLIYTAFMDWIHWYLETPPKPYISTCMALMAILYSIYKVIKIRRKLESLRLGRDGEKAVAEMLNFYREAKMKVFHDIVGDDFNIDHVVVSTRGVFLIETKTYSKPMKGKTEILYTGKKIIKNGYTLNDDILVQVKASKKWIEELIEDLTTKKVSVQPVVVFPGWYVKMTNEHPSDIWMLNPKNLDKFIMGKNEFLSQEDVKLISNHLARYIRSTS